MAHASLFQPLKLGRYELAHRVVMPPLTRMRAGRGNAPTDLAVEYYAQRTSPGGLIIAEGTQISQSAQGYPATPGIHSQDQIDGWKKVTEAVHAKGGLIFLQLWHTGRASHSSFQPDGTLPVAPSAIPITTQKVFTAAWKQVDYETPRALRISEIAGTVDDYRQAARNAMEAGFDGVELHAANGYLIEQFLHSRSNHRDDAYGGSVENRARLLHEATEALVEVWGADRVGVRLSPFGEYNDVGDADPIALYGQALTRFSKLGLAYLSLIEARDGAGMEIGALQTLDQLRAFWPGTLIVAGGFNAASADAAIKAGRADAVAFGRHFIANPDLPDRIKVGAKLNPYHRKTFYGGGADGYVDYPALNATEAAD